jgi:hypothetical protein
MGARPKCVLSSLQEFVDHYHRAESSGLENRLIESRPLGRREGGIHRRPRLYLPALPIQPAREDGAQQLKRRRVDHGGNLYHGTDTGGSRSVGGDVEHFGFAACPAVSAQHSQFEENYSVNNARDLRRARHCGPRRRVMEAFHEW